MLADIHAHFLHIRRLLNIKHLDGKLWEMRMKGCDASATKEAGTMNRTPDTLEQKLLANPEVQAAYDELTPEYALARELIAARVRAGLSQSQLAERMNTKQSTIARLESGKVLPSMRTLHRIAEATNSRASVTLTNR